MAQSAASGNGELVSATGMPWTLTSAALVSGDGATQGFTAVGRTTLIAGVADHDDWSNDE